MTNAITCKITGADFIEKDNRAIRDQYVTRTEVLDKVKGLAMLPDDVHVTTEMAAEYYEVAPDNIKMLLKSHRGEFEGDGVKVITGQQLNNLKLLSPLVNKHTKHLSLLPRRAVLRLGMLITVGKVAKAVRSYLLNVEEIAREKAPQVIDETIERLYQAFPNMPRTFSESLRMLADTTEENEQLRAEVKVLTPKAEKFDRFLNADGYIHIGDMAKIFNIPGLGPRKMFEYLRDRSILYKNEDRNVPAQRYLNAGYFYVKNDTMWLYGRKKLVSTTYVTAEGINYIYGLLAGDGYIAEGLSA